MSEYRFVFEPNFDKRTISAFFGDPVQTLEQANIQLDLVANYTLHLHELSLMPDHSNYGFIEKRNNDSNWIEVEQEIGE